MTKPDTMTWTVGLLLRGPFRRYLDHLRFDGHVDDWYEGKGFLESDFKIRVTDRRAWNLIMGWCQEHGAD